MNGTHSVAELPLPSEASLPSTAPSKQSRNHLGRFAAFGKQTRKAIETGVDFLAFTAAWQYAAWIVTSFFPATHGSAPPLDAVLLLFPASWELVRVRRRRQFGRAASLLSGMADLVITLSVLTLAATLVARQTGAAVSVAFPFLLPPLLVAFLAPARASLWRVLRESAAMETTAVVGTLREASALVASMRTRGDRSIRGVVVVDSPPPTAVAQTRSGARNGIPTDVEVLGQALDVGALINRHQLDRIIIQERGLSSEQVDRVLDITTRMRVNTSRILDLDRVQAEPQLIDFCGLPLIDFAPSSVLPLQGRAKRIFDLIGAATVLALTLPGLALIAILIKLDDPGPVFYRGVRVGRGGRHFTFFKFRSMRHKAVHRPADSRRTLTDGHLFKLRGDPRVTRVGRWLRRSSLDELPQLLNVLKGEMSLVGPRPLPAEDLDPDGLSTRFPNWSLERALVMPGITGLWQVSGRSDLPFERMIDLDLRYAREWSLALDIRILLETPPAVLVGRGAY